MSSDHETLYGSETEYSSGEYETIFETRWYQSQPPTDILPLVIATQTERKVVKKPIRPQPEPSIVEFFCDFVSLVGRKKCKKLMPMINHYSNKMSKTEPLPYSCGTTACTRLELESEMCRISPELYGEFISKLSASKMRWLVKNHSIRNRTFSEANVTALMYENYVGRYVVVMEGRSASVWMFDGGWMEISQAEIWQEMSTSFIDFLSSFISTGDEEWKGLCDDVVRYMASVASRERIQRDLMQRLSSTTFQSKLNSKSHLIGMKNGVYDLEKGKLRDALPMDYVSMSTGIDYLEKDNVVLRKELKGILRTVFPDKRVRKFFVRSCASLLEGRNKEKYVFVWWGEGNNAKSMMEKLLATALGDYSTVAATSLVTAKRGNADNASPQLSVLEGKLSVFLQEPNPDETIKIGMIKELSGNDAITARALFKNNRTFVPKFKLIIVCNTAIEIPNIDVAFTNRLIVIPFESTFRTKEDYRRRERKGTLTDYDHLMDSSVAREIGRYAETFFRMLVEEYEKMEDKPLHVPRRVRKATDDYIKENNFSLRYIAECCTDDEKGEVNIKSLHSEMKAWMNQHHGGKKVPNIDIFRKEVANLGYNINSKGIVHGLAVDFD